MKKPFKYRHQRRVPNDRLETNHQNTRQIDEKRPAPAPEPKAPPKFYKVVFYQSFAMAKGDRDRIISECNGCDQLNVVIREEGNMDDQELLGLDPKVKLFAGEAWNLIHERRVADAWYNEAH